MIVGREELVVLEKFASMQKQIWPDSADVGLKDSGEDRDVSVIQTAEIRLALHELMKTFKFTTNKWGEERDGGWQCRLFVPYEQDGDEYQGVMVQVGYHRSRMGTKRQVTFITIDIGSWHQKDSGFKSE